MALARNDSSPLFAEGASSTLRLVIYLALAITVMVVDRHFHYVEILRTRTSAIIEPIYRLAAMPAKLAHDARLAFSDRNALSEENLRLREALMLSQARLNRLGVVQEQNQRLKQLLDVQNGLGVGVQLAKLIDLQLDPLLQRIVLDAGSAEGVSVGQAVIDAHGVVGQIIEVWPHTSKAMLITDPSHALPVRIERSGVRVIARGSGVVDRLDLLNIPASADVKVGDKLVTSGFGGRFPAGFPVGEIVEVKNDPSGLFGAAVARPSAALDRTDEVLLLHELADPIGPPAPAEIPGPPLGIAPKMSAATAAQAKP
jgi:rod shape-determining protein MreC